MSSKTALMGSASPLVSANTIQHGWFFIVNTDVQHRIMGVKFGTGQGHKFLLEKWSLRKA